MANSTDDRLKKAADTGRENRGAATDNDPREEAIPAVSFRNEFSFDALPNLPNIPGYKTIWLTTTNPRDTIQARIRLGYTPVTAADIPGFENLKMKSGEYDGMIGVNEMLAFKLPIEQWEKYMTELHHTAPLEEEEKLRAQLELMRDGRGNSLVAEIGDGMKSEPLRGRPDFGLRK